MQIVEKNQCSKIMTGAIVPDGCDVVFMVEESGNFSNGKIRFSGTDLKFNISVKGEDVRTGDVVLKKGKLIQPQDVAVMASVGHTKVNVKKKPVVGIISTGDELINPSDFPAISQIRNSNAYQLDAQVTRAGGTAIEYGIAPDNENITYGIIQKAIHECDIVIITGGVSMGDFDFVPGVLIRSGVKILFDRVNVQPGKTNHIRRAFKSNCIWTARESCLFIHSIRNARSTTDKQHDGLYLDTQRTETAIGHKL
jgi:molybdopterin molybdotransferase